MHVFIEERAKPSAVASPSVSCRYNWEILLFHLVPPFRKTAEVSLGAWGTFFPYHFSEGYIQMGRSICHPPSVDVNTSHFQARPFLWELCWPRQKVTAEVIFPLRLRVPGACGILLCVDTGCRWSEERLVTALQGRKLWGGLWLFA